MICPAESDLPVYLEIMTSNSVGIPAEKYLAVNGGEEEEMDEYPCEIGGKITGFEKFADFNEEIMQGFYVIQAGDEWAAAYLSCPMEAMEGFGRRLSAILETVSFGPLPAVRVEDGEEMDGLPSIVVSDDEYSTWVTFAARRPVRKPKCHGGAKPRSIHLCSTKAKILSTKVGGIFALYSSFLSFKSSFFSSSRQDFLNEY